jgi:hypothetical protein
MTGNGILNICNYSGCQVQACPGATFLEDAVVVANQGRPGILNLSSYDRTIKFLNVKKKRGIKSNYTKDMGNVLFLQDKKEGKI